MGILPTTALLERQYNEFLDTGGFDDVSAEELLILLDNRLSDVEQEESTIQDTLTTTIILAQIKYLHSFTDQ